LIIVEYVRKGKWKEWWDSGYSRRRI